MQEKVTSREVQQMIRIILVAVILIGFLVVSYPLLLLEKRSARKDPRKQRQHSQDIVKKVFTLLLRISGVKVTVKGLENIPEGAVLYVGNHQSYYDILLGYTTVPGLLGFVAKKEMLRWPLLSDWMVLVNCLFLDRDNIKEGLKTILQGIEKIKEGVSVWIFPEGTRNESKDPLDLMQFREGSLKIAEKSGCPVVPVAITGTPAIFENHIPFVRPAHVTIEYGRPFRVKELPPESRKRPGAYTRDVIIGMLEKEQTAS
jgi:1-acyl-sn-glycerol-3-phosphate acyltransferase